MINVNQDDKKKKNLLVLWKDEKATKEDCDVFVANSQLEIISKLRNVDYRYVYCTGNMPLYIRNIMNMVKI